KREVPLFDDYIIARKIPTVRFHPDVTCPHCQKAYDWEFEVASLILGNRRMGTLPMKIKLLCQQILMTRVTPRILPSLDFHGTGND
ncbi:MAG TPA: hypothetical protein VMX56_03460, partial [Anaerolineales bacterium]|nr:hypothetical protein [Anaerolineales bacterium]